MDQLKIGILSNFGFHFKKGSVHTSRTMMLEDMNLLLSDVINPGASKNDYLKAIEEDNCLGKRSGRTRKLSYEYLVELYSLDPSITIFRALRYFWERDTDGRPLLTLICAYSRDAILQMSAPFIMEHEEGNIISREAFEACIENKFPDRFSKATLKSLVRNLRSTWTKSGHLIGKTKKVRSKANATPGSVSYALFLGYLTGVRGEELFRTEYALLLDCSINRSIELAEDASRKGWIVFKRVGNVIEVLFPNLLTEQEREWIREQN
jgi:hypothetical protein